MAYALKNGTDGISTTATNRGGFVSHIGVEIVNVLDVAFCIEVHEFP